VIYTITLMRGSQLTRTETFRGEPDIAKALSIAAVDNGEADLADIRDLSGHLIFRYPRTFYT